MWIQTLEQTSFSYDCPHVLALPNETRSLKQFTFCCNHDGAMNGACRNAPFIYDAIKSALEVHLRVSFQMVSCFVALT